jgi:7,8-dihydropterin-6-yl-methyl-4-(beta-D-ribofuranosyl)aminobenzene 5'-phosphate synthase
VSEVVLTHNHDDHVGGLLTLRRELMKKNRSALSRVHVAKGIFYSRPSGKGEDNAMIAIKPEYEATGGQFIEHDQAEEIFPGGWLTGQFWSRVIFRKTSRYAASTLANSHSLGTD